MIYMFLILAAIAAAVAFGWITLTVGFLIGIGVVLFWDVIASFLGPTALSPEDQKIRPGAALASLLSTNSLTSQPAEYRGTSCGCAGSTCSCS